MLQPGEIEIFREIQPLHRNLLVRIVLPLETVVFAAVLAAVAATAPASTLIWMAAAFVVFAIALPWWLLTRRLVTLVTDRRLIVRLPPFPGRAVDLERITHAEAVRYNPIADAGGWGWRFSRKYHRVFNISGDLGVHVRYGEGRKEQFLVGSERPEEVATAIEAARLELGGSSRALRSDEAPA